MKMKAKKLFTTYGKYSNIVTYEYRGKQYDVEFATDFSYCVTPAKVQHEDAQERIDKEIEQESKPKTSAKFNADEVYALMGWDE